MFEKFAYTNEQVIKYFEAANRDFAILKNESKPDIIFYLTYNVLIKSAMAVSAKNNLRVKSRAGHHIELINKFTQVLDNPAIELRLTR